MLDRRRFFSYALTGVSVGLSVSTTALLLNNPAHAAGDMSYPASEFIQIEVTDFSRKEDRYNYVAYRINPQNLVSGARWTGARKLLGITKGSVLSPVSFDHARKVVAGELGWLQSRKGSEGGRFSNWVSVAHSTPQKTRNRVLRDPVPQPVANLAQQLAAVPLHAPATKGAYVLTSPVQRSTAQDLKIDGQSSTSTLAQAIITSLSSDHLAVPVDMTHEIARYLEGENTNRLVFAAKFGGNFSGRVSHFTIVTAA